MDPVTPRFVYFSSIHFDELDAMQMLHNARFAAHVERAVIAWYHAMGRTWRRDPADNPDQFHVVRDFHIEYLRPVIGPGTMRIDVWLERMGTTSCVYCRITTAGLQLLDRLAAPVQEAAELCFESFTKRDLARLVESLGRTRERMNQEFIERRRSQ